MLFDRALTAGEIAALYDAGSLGACKDEDGDGFRPPIDCNEDDLKQAFTNKSFEVKAESVTSPLTRDQARASMEAWSAIPIPPAPTRPRIVASLMLISHR